MNVSTFGFEAAHGQSPRGNGLWFFDFSGHATKNPMTIRRSGKYSEVKKEMIQIAKEEGYTQISVCS